MDSSDLDLHEALLWLAVFTSLNSTPLRRRVLRSRRRPSGSFWRHCSTWAKAIGAIRNRRRSGTNDTRIPVVLGYEDKLQRTFSTAGARQLHREWPASAN